MDRSRFVRALTALAFTTHLGTLGACAMGEEPGGDGAQGTLDAQSDGTTQGDARTDGRVDARTDGRTDAPMDIVRPDAETMDGSISIDPDASSTDRDARADRGPLPDVPSCTLPQIACGTACIDPRTDENHCGRCGNACASGQQCTNSACVVTCATGQTSCTVDGTPACIDTRTDPNHCGACDRVCAMGQNCEAGVCRTPMTLANDACANATAITMSAGAQTLRVDTTSATNEAGITAPCGTNVGGDVFYSFTLARREVVYADAFGSSFDTVLYFASSCTAPVTMVGTGEQACGNDASCPTANRNARIVAVLPAGTHYLVLAGNNGAKGNARIRFEHLPVGNGATANLPSGDSVFRGTTSGTGNYPLSCGSVSGGGAEASLWWLTCPDARSGTLYADTCSGTNFDSILFQTNGSTGSGVCNDDDDDFWSGCEPQSYLESTIPAGAGLHVLTIDGYNSSDNGAFTIHVSRP